MINNNTYPCKTEKTLLIHASAVYTDKGAMVFLGPSNTGKSTICRLLDTYTQPLADDGVYLTSHNGGWQVTDGTNLKPLSKSGLPLLAVFRLHQAPTVRLERLGTWQTCRHLTDAFFEVRWQRQYDRKTKKNAFQVLAAIARSTPGFRLYFNLSARTFDIINETLDAQVQFFNQVHYLNES